MARHCFLTGAHGCGKSGVIHKAVALTGLLVGGFRTNFGPDRSVLYMSRADLPFAPSEDSAVAEYRDGKMTAIPGRFDELGERYLLQSREFAGLIIMDELGFLERDAQGFRRAVLATLDRPVPVLGVLREGFPAWTREIADRADVSVITVTAKNRDVLPMTLARRLLNEE